MKRGSSHIEIILAFILFAGFIGFSLYFFSPTNTRRLVDTNLIYAFDEIRKNASVDVDFYSIKINSDTPPTPDKIKIDLGNIEENKKSYVEDIDGGKLDSYKAGQYVNIDRRDRGFVYLLLSEDIAPDEAIDGIFNSKYYTIASSNTKYILSEKRMEDLNKTYYSDYLNLKKERFNLPDRVNFGDELKFNDGTFIKMEKQIPEGLDVYSNSKRIEVIRKNNKIEFADLVVKVW